MRRPRIPSIFDTAWPWYVVVIVCSYSAGESRPAGALRLGGHTMSWADWAFVAIRLALALAALIAGREIDRRQAADAARRVADAVNAVRWQAAKERARTMPPNTYARRAYDDGAFDDEPPPGARPAG